MKCHATLLLLLTTLTLSQAGEAPAKQQQQQQLDTATCKLLCVSCEKSRQVFAQLCTSPANNATEDCPCLRLPGGPHGGRRAGNCTTAAGDCQGGPNDACPEPQPPPPPPGCPPGGSVRCELGGPGGRCFGSCVCLTPAATGAPAACPPDPCPPSNCRAYATTSDQVAGGCRRCSDCAANPWWCFAEPPDTCGNATEVCGAGRRFRRDPDGCQVDCACADTEEPPPPTANAAATATSLSCRLPPWLSASCRRYCLRRYGAGASLQADERGCERCRCCPPCERRRRLGLQGGARHRRPLRLGDGDCQGEVSEGGGDGCAGCQCD